MPTHFSHTKAIRLRGDAKALRRGDQTLTQTQALDIVAQREGWPNWALLERNLQPLSLDEQVKTSVEPYEGGVPGVFLVRLVLQDKDVIGTIKRAGGLAFELPAIPPRWFVRRFTNHEDRADDPFLDRRAKIPLGRFVDEQFLCILSTNGVQPSEIGAEVDAQLNRLAANFHHEAVRALASLQNGDSSSEVTLLFAAINAHGIRSVEQLRFASISQAQEAKLGENDIPILIIAQDRSLMYQHPFGWTEMRPPY